MQRQPAAGIRGRMMTAASRLQGGKAGAVHKKGMGEVFLTNNPSKSFYQNRTTRPACLPGRLHGLIPSKASKVFFVCFWSPSTPTSTSSISSLSRIHICSFLPPSTSRSLFSSNGHAACASPMLPATVFIPVCATSPP